MLLTSENTGVIPLPPAKATIGVVLGRSVKTPAGRVRASTSPSPTRSSIQFDTRPPATRFTVSVSSVSVAGELDIE